MPACCRFKKQSKKIPGKGGQRYWKNVGLGFKTPKEAMEGTPCTTAVERACLHRMLSCCVHTGTYIDKKCPFTGNVSIRGRILSGVRGSSISSPRAAAVVQPADLAPTHAGVVKSAKMTRTIIVRRNYAHFIKKYARCLLGSFLELMHVPLLLSTPSSCAGMRSGTATSRRMCPPASA